MAYIGVQPTDTYLSIASQQITGTGSATYTLDYSVSNEEDVAVFVNNVRQNVSTYTVSGTSLTLGGTISASDSCWVLFLGRTVGTKTPAVGSVTNDMLAGSIANSKLANSSITLNGSAVSLGGSATIVNNIGCVQRASSATTVSNTTTTKLTFPTTVRNEGSAFNTTNSRFTAPVSGIYEVNSFHQHGGMSGYVTYYIYVDGTAQYEYVNEHGNHYGYPSSGINASVYLGTNQYIEIYVQHNSGGNLLFYSDRWSHFGATLVTEV